MKVIYHGHSCVQLIHEQHSILIDPFLTGNPTSVAEPGDLKTDYVLLTHAHPDHIGDTESIARSNDAMIVGSFELSTYYGWKGLRTLAMNIGGTIDLGFAQVKMVQAFHSSGMIVEEEQRIIYMGMPAGYVITWDGATILHSGDTSLFGDMKLIGEQHAIDLALLPIGDTFTMGPADALIAAEWLQAKAVIPIHHGTWPVIAQDIEHFSNQLKERGITGIPLRPGQEYELPR